MTEDQKKYFDIKNLGMKNLCCCKFSADDCLGYIPRFNVINCHCSQNMRMYAL